MALKKWGKFSSTSIEVLEMLKCLKRDGMNPRIMTIIQRVKLMNRRGVVWLNANMSLRSCDDTISWLLKSTELMIPINIC